MSTKVSNADIDNAKVKFKQLSLAKSSGDTHVSYFSKIFLMVTDFITVNALLLSSEGLSPNYHVVLHKWNKYIVFWPPIRPNGADCCFYFCACGVKEHTSMTV